MEITGQTEIVDNSSFYGMEKSEGQMRMLTLPYANSPLQVLSLSKSNRTFDASNFHHIPQKLGHNELAWAVRAAVFSALNAPGGRPKRLAYVTWPCLRALYQSGGLISLHDQPRRVRYDRVFTGSTSMQPCLLFPKSTIPLPQ